MLRICQQLASLLQQYNTSSAVFFTITYFDFKFTSANNQILFCCIRRNVEPCCHTHDSRTTMNVYSARPRLIGLALYTVTDSQRDYVQRVALGRPIPAVNKKPAAKCKIQTRVQRLVIAKPYSLKVKILAYPICIRGPRQGVPVVILPCRLVWKNQNGTRWWTNVEDTFIRFYMIHERDRHTHRQTYRQTPHDGKGSAAKITYIP